MVSTADEMLGALEHKKDELEEIKRNLGRKIKCVYCEHESRSIVKESWPWAAPLIVILAFLALGIMACVLVPCILGVLRRQIHCCPRCLNQIREESVFECLDD